MQIRCWNGPVFDILTFLKNSNCSRTLYKSTSNILEIFNHEKRAKKKRKKYTNQNFAVSCHVVYICVLMQVIYQNGPVFDILTFLKKLICSRTLYKSTSNILEIFHNKKRAKKNKKKTKTKKPKNHSPIFVIAAHGFVFWCRLDAKMVPFSIF